MQSTDPNQRPLGSAPAGGFDMNQPTIIALIYLVSFLTGGFLSLIGVVLAFVWKDDARGRWDESHYIYLINTFWIMLVGGFITLFLMFVLIGFLLFPLLAIWIIVRCVMSLQRAQKQQPMPDPTTLKW